MFYEGSNISIFLCLRYYYYFKAKFEETIHFSLSSMQILGNGVLYAYNFYSLIIQLSLHNRLTTATCCGNRACLPPSRTTCSSAGRARCRSRRRRNRSSYRPGSSCGRVSRRRSPPLSCRRVRTPSHTLRPVLQSVSTFETVFSYRSTSKALIKDSNWNV